MERSRLIKVIILLALLCGLLICLNAAFRWHRAASNAGFPKQLLMVNMFSRHGDRGPVDDFPPGDRHASKVDFFWPNGRFNLTDAGMYRMFRLGLALRQTYGEYLDFNADHVLAFSSKEQRCQTSLELTLRGLFNIEITTSRGRQLLSQQTNCNDSACGGLSADGGSSIEWRRVNIDTQALASLTWSSIQSCPYRQANPDPYEDDWLRNPHVRSIVGIEQLRDLLRKRYAMKHLTSAETFALFSVISVELELQRTGDTIEYMDHFSNWIGRPVEQRAGSTIRLLDVLEAACVIAYRDQYRGQARVLQLGSIVTSIVQSQMVALGRVHDPAVVSRYAGRKMVLYSGHDSAMQSLMYALGMMDFWPLDYADRFFELELTKGESSSVDELDAILAGIRLVNYGASMRFELWQLQLAEGVLFPVVEASIYNEADSKRAPMKFTPVTFGLMCRRLFRQQYPASELSQFYPADTAIDIERSCPFDLFRNLTSRFVQSEAAQRKLCLLREVTSD